MNVAIAGASGLVGSALVPALKAAGHKVVRLVRREARSTEEVFWNPESGEIDVGALAGVEAVINLAGENIGAGRWTAARRERILRSRVDGTRTLVAAMAKVTPKPAVLLNASAAGFYGDRGDELLDEGSGLGQGFLPGVCLAWETHAEGATRLGIRTVLLRFGVILSGAGGALDKLTPLFRLGLGGRLGSGAQWMSWVSIDDVVGIILTALTNRRIAGVVNVVAPQPITNAEFTATLGRVLKRPAVLPVPKMALRLVVGRGMADEALLASTRAVPRRLIEAGYRFKREELAGALRSALGREV